jgi:hypothetical protein
MYIACPKCDWHPDAAIVWKCTCGHHWNTFQTHGVCPACGKIWQETQCHPAIGCGQWSDHEEWYHEDDGLTVEDVIANPARIAQPLPNAVPE